MFCRLSRKVLVLTPYIRAQQHHIPAVYNRSFVRVISQTPQLHYEELKGSDLLFDLGGQNQTRRPKNGKVDEKQSSPSNARTTRANRSTNGKLLESTNNSKHAKRSSKPRITQDAQPDEIPNENQTQTQRDPNEKRTPKIKSKNTTRFQRRADKKLQTFDELKHFDTSLNLEYVRLPKNHWQFSEMMLLLKSRRHRERENLILIEGSRLIGEATDAGLKLKYLLFSNVEHVEKMRHDLDRCIVAEQPGKTTVMRVPQNDLAFWSTQTTCPGLIALFRKPADMEDIWSHHRSTIEVDGRQIQTPITIVCDQIREPNNLGSILRTCAAVACEKVIVLKGCADPWDAKAMRGGCGAQFRTEIVHGVDWTDINEHIPDSGKTTVFLADNKVQSDDSSFMPHDEKDFKRKLNIEKSYKPKAYNDVNFTDCEHVTLVIGGETEGVSSRAYDFMRSTMVQAKSAENGADTVAQSPVTRNTILQIPLGHGVESLNVGVATGILLFEIRRQLIGQ